MLVIWIRDLLTLLADKNQTEALQLAQLDKNLSLITKAALNIIKNFLQSGSNVSGFLGYKNFILWYYL